MKYWNYLKFAFLPAILSCANIDETDIVEQNESAFVFGSDNRTAVYPALPIYRIRIKQGNGTYEYCTATVYHPAKHHFVTDARCFFTWKNGVATQVANTDISIQWVTGGTDWSASITHVMIAPEYRWMASDMGDNLVDPRSQPTIARSYAFFRTSWNTSAVPIPMERTTDWFNLNCSTTGGGCGTNTTFVAVGAQAYDAQNVGCLLSNDGSGRDAYATLHEPYGCKTNRLYESTFTIKPAEAALSSCYKSWCKSNYPAPNVAPPYANMAGDCLMQDANEMYGDVYPNAVHTMDASSLYGIGSDNFGGDLGGPILNSSKTKIMGIMAGSLYRNTGSVSYANVWIPTVEIALAKSTNCLYKEHILTEPFERASMWEYANFFAQDYP